VDRISEGLWARESGFRSFWVKRVTTLCRRTGTCSLRFMIGELARAAEADLRDPQTEPDLFVLQVEERLSRL